MYLDCADPRLMGTMSIDYVSCFTAVLSATLLGFILAGLNKKLDCDDVVKGAVAVRKRHLGKRRGGVPAKYATRYKSDIISANSVGIYD